MIKKVLAGKDSYGNSYYQGCEKRFVKYFGEKDPTTISSDWHLWLHYAVDHVSDSAKINCQLDRIPNKTGTSYAYNPNNFKANKQDDYFPWKPNLE